MVIYFKCILYYGLGPDHLVSMRLLLGEGVFHVLFFEKEFLLKELMVNVINFTKVQTFTKY